MARDTLDCQLTAPTGPSARFILATDENDAAIRRLLRENPTPGEISLSFEREPSYFRSTHIAGADCKTILGFLGKQLIGVGRCTFRHCFINGEVRRVGYLSDLRLDTKVQGRFDILRRGYRFFHELHRDDPADFYFTSIAADNERSIRFLERGLPGMPTYKFATDFVTLLIPVPRHARRKNTQEKFKTPGLKCVTGNHALADQIVSCLNAHAKQSQLAALWTKDNLFLLEGFGLTLSDFQVVFDKNNSVAACIALWDQRSFKQTVVHGYAPKISAASPLMNLFSKFFGTIHLPPIGSTLAFGFVSPVAIGSGYSELLPTLIESLMPVAAERGLEFLTLGFASNDDKLTAIRSRFSCREYRTRLHQVAWDKSEEIILDARPFSPELALL
jgi:hypothetical protein